VEQHSFGYQKTGRPSKQNFKEYLAAVQKLQSVARNPWASDIGGAYLVLVYADPTEVGPLTFGSFYDGISAEAPVRSIEVIECPSPLGSDRVLTCKLLEISVSTAG
jgi:hypothetical protein